MTDKGQRNGSTGPGPSGGPKAIGSLAKKQSDVTRQGTQKLKFVPTLQPARKKKEEVKQEAPPTPSVPTAADRGTGRGRGRGRGRAPDGRGAAPRAPPVEMTASGPFAMGPALAGTSARRSAPRSNFTPVGPLGSSTPSTLGANLSNTAAPTLKKEKQRENVLAGVTEDVQKYESDEEAYSEPDEGVEIIDMENVGQMDWMAPETLRKERRDRKKKRLVKVEERESTSKGKEVIKSDRGGAPDSIDLSNALDLSESDDEEELEDLIEDFAMQAEKGQDEGVRQERLLFFQFPEPFPTFVSNATPGPPPADVDMSEQGPSEVKQRRVSFAADVKPPAPVPGTAMPSIATDAPQAPKVDGIIGQLEVYRSGAVKMRLDNGIVMNISEATQPSFLQQAVHLDIETKRLHVIGEVNKRFVVSPDLDTLLNAMEIADRRDEDAMAFDDVNLIRMEA